MNNWTDPIIHWNQLPGTEVKRLLATWGMDEKAIARYDAKHGFARTDNAGAVRANDGGAFFFFIAQQVALNVHHIL